MLTFCGVFACPPQCCSSHVHTGAPLRFFPQVRGLVLTVSKLFITTTLFVFLMYMSESRSAATGMCGALLSIAGICSAQAASRRDAAGEGQSGGSGGSGSSREGGEDEEEDAVLLSQKR